MKEIYNDYIAKYKQLPYNEKRKEILEKVKTMIGVLGSLVPYNEDWVNKELLDLKQSFISDDDYLEGLFVYLNILEDLVAKLIIKSQDSNNIN